MIIKSQISAETKRNKSWRFPFVKTSRDDSRIVQIYKGQRLKQSIPIYVSRSMLEEKLLLNARSLIWGISSVVIEYARSAESCRNWRVVGFATGTADRDRAASAIEMSANRYELWVMVEDTDERINRPVDLCKQNI